MRDLLLLKIEGRQYGIWKEDIVSIRDIQTLHRIPLSPAVIAGISIIDDRTVTLADLSVCMGYSRREGNGKDHVLLLSGTDKIGGFIVSGDTDYLSVSNDRVFPIPDYLKTDSVDSCAVLNNFLIPIINIANVSLHMLRSGELPCPQLTVADQERGSTISAVRVFELGGELFAAASTGREEPSSAAVELAHLSLVPDYVRGITYHNGSTIPVIDLSQLIKRQKSRSDGCMMVCEISGQVFGLLADKEHGIFPVRDMVISDLPPIARSLSLTSAVLKTGEIVPILDLASLLRKKEKDDLPLEERYSAGSPFASLFKKQDVDVVEFLLLGVRHAVPRSEVEDILPVKSFRQVPQTPEIVAGIVAHNGEVLPVLDLAVIFGGRSPITSDWSMILLKNGDFRALVLTETVFGARRLPLGIQRSVPIRLPYQVVYGCYPASEAVRLIFNVLAIAVHFEKPLVKELLPALSEEMKQAAVEIVGAPAGLRAEFFLSEKTASTVEPGPEIVPPVELIKEPEVVAANDSLQQNLINPTAEVITADLTEQEQKPEYVVQQTIDEIPDAAVTEEEKEESISPPPDIDAALPVSETETAGLREIPEETVTGEPELGQVTPTENQSAQPIGDSDGEGEAAEQAEEAFEETISRDTGSETVSAIEETPANTTAEQAIEPAFQDWAAQEASSADKTYQEPFFQPEPEPEPEPGKGVYYPTAKRSDKSWKKVTGIGLVAMLLAALLYFAGSFKNSPIEKSAKEAQAPAKIAKTETKAQAANEKQEAPLVLDVPAIRAVNIDVYVVIKGDTLWSISERFTGNPFNYPRIAGENRIADPDLIFPGQKIRLVKK